MEIIASLSIPWGFNKGDEDLGGYHLVWPRDLVETAGALVAAGDFEGARRVLHWLETAQEADGHWPQNCWLDGAPYWTGVQMDECAFPPARRSEWREGGLRDDELQRFWPMVLRAAGFVVRNGPVTGQDRWEALVRAECIMHPEVVTTVFKPRGASENPRTSIDTNTASISR